MDIEKLLTLPEGKTLEFKENLNSIKPILKTLIAFSNTAGGVLIIGRADDGKVIGVSNVFDMEEKLANAISDSISPPLMPEIEMVSVKGHSLLVISVSRWRGPFYLKSQGENEGTYIRLGSTNREAGPEILGELKRAAMQVSFDQLPCLNTSYQDLDSNLIEKVFSRIEKKATLESLKSLGVLLTHNDQLICSNGGVILFGKKEVRDLYFSNSEVRCARFKGEDKVNFVDQYDVQGTILDAIDEIPKFIQRNTQLAAEIQHMRRKNIPEYSPIIIREVLTNALVHADYSIKGMHPRVAIYSNRLEIESPGMLPFGYVLDDFFLGVSHVRNKVIARVFRELNLMEEWGTGYKRINYICKTEGYPIPTWEEVGPTVRVISKPHVRIEATSQNGKKISYVHNGDDLSIRQEEIIKLLGHYDILTTKEIHKKLSISIAERTLRGDLVDLKRRAIIKMLGRGPSTKWKLQN